MNLIRKTYNTTINLPPCFWDITLQVNYTVTDEYGHKPEIDVDEWLLITPDGRTLDPDKRKHKRLWRYMTRLAREDVEYTELHAI